MTTTTTKTEEQETSAPPNTPPPRSKLRDRLRKPLPIDEARPIEESQDGDPVETQIREASDADDEKGLRTKYERLGLTKATKQLREEEDKSIVDWLKSLEAEAPIKISVRRREPKEWTDPRDGQRKKVDGHLRTYDRPIDEVEIQRVHGGGTIQLVIQKKEGTGYKFLTSRTLEIAGDPKFDDVPRAVAPPPPAPVMQQDVTTGKVVDRVLDHMLSQSRMPPPAPPDISGAISAAVAPYRDALARVEHQMERREEELRQARAGNPEETQFRERLLEKFIDQDSARLQAVRSQYESEIRILKENHLQNESRMRDSFQRDKDAIERSHQRELDNFKSANELKISALEQSFQVQKTVIEAENRRLDRELQELRAEIKELRNKKDPSFKDQLAGIRDMKDLIGDVMGDDGDDKEDKSTLVKVLEGAASSPVIANFAQNLMGAAAGPPPEVVAAQQQAMLQQQRQMAAPPRQRRGRLIRDKRNGQVYATDGVKAIPVQKKQPLAPPPAATQVVVDEQGNQTIVEVPSEQQAPPPAETAAPIPYVEPEKVAIAANYMLQAFSNNVPPDDFVTGVKMFIPKEIVAALEQMGPEDFLRRVGGLPDEHPLLSQAGKNWVRKVSKRLLGE